MLVEESKKTEASDDERAAVGLLLHVTCPVGSWDKRFIRSLPRPEAGYALLISNNQRRQIWRLFIRYRRQIGHKEKARLLTIAQENAAPDFRKQQAASLELARIEDLKKQFPKKSPVDNDVKSR